MGWRQLAAVALSLAVLPLIAAPALAIDYDLSLTLDPGWERLGPIGLRIDGEGGIDPLALYLRGELWGYEWRAGFMTIDWGPSLGEDLLYSGRLGLPLGFIATDYDGFEILPPMRYENFYARLEPRAGSDRYLIGRRYTMERGAWRVGLIETALLSGDFSPYYLIPYPFFPLSVCKVFLDRSIVGDDRDANLLYGLDAGYSWDGGSAYGALLIDEAPCGEREAPWRVGLQLGAEIGGLLGRDDLGLWLEYTAVSRYTFTYHAGYEAGDYWQDGEVIGHSLGPDADLFRARLTRDFSSWRGWAELAVERHGEGRFGERWVPADGEELEILTGTVETSYWLRFGRGFTLGQNLEFRVELGAAYVDNLDNVAGETGSEYCLNLQVGYGF